MTNSPNLEGSPALHAQLDDGDRRVIALLGIDESQYRASLAASGRRTAMHSAKGTARDAAGFDSADRNVIALLGLDPAEYAASQERAGLTTAVHASSGSPPIAALCAAMPIDGNLDAGGVPDWIHLLPAGAITTQDGRGPYTVGSMAALAEQLNASGKLAVDECHSTDLAAPNGSPAPARGWMKAFEARDNGLWAEVDWTRQGRSLMEDGAYNGISPVIVHTKDNSVVGLLRASLTNAPNLKGLTALHSQFGAAASRL